MCKSLFAWEQVLESVVKNCGQTIHDEVASKQTMEELKELFKVIPANLLSVKSVAVALRVLGLCLYDLSKWVKANDSCGAALPDCVVTSHVYLSEGSSSRNQKHHTAFEFILLTFCEILKCFRWLVGIWICFVVLSACVFFFFFMNLSGNFWVLTSRLRYCFQVVADRMWLFCL